jgi:bifunctional DNase/RNase
MRSSVALGIAVGVFSVAAGVGAVPLPPSNAPTMVQMTVRTVGVISGQYVVLLEDSQHKMQLAMTVGPLEAIAIDRRMRGEKTPRPMTHDLFESTLTSLGARVERVEVIEMRDDIYIGRLSVRDSKGQTHAIDARSSDSIALALGAGVPIFVAQPVLTQAGFPAQAVP